MRMKKYYLRFEPLSKMFYVEDSVLQKFVEEKDVPQFELPENAYNRLGCASPTEEAPVVGLMMERAGNAYCASWGHVLALAQTGAKIVFLTYLYCSEQLTVCHGLVLPGGVLKGSEQYDNKLDSNELRYLCQMAYNVCIRKARERKLPLLGIGTGAQIIACSLALKLYHDSDSIETPIHHNVKEAKAHRLNVFADTPLQSIFGDNNQFYVNSRHSALLAPVRVQKELWAKNNHIAVSDVQLPLDFYAEANDGTPEAWGSEEEHILCVQWHPEEMVAAGDTDMLGIYRWLVDKIAK